MWIPFRKSGIILIFISFTIILTGCAEDKALTKRQSLAKQDLGKSFLAQGDFTAGLNELLKAEELNPENSEIQYNLAIAYRFKDLHSKSITHFKKAIELRQNFSEAYNDLGNTYLILSKFDLAIKCFEKTLENPVYATPHFAYNNLGQAYYNKGEYKKAVESYLKAIKYQPSFSMAFHHLGITYEAMNEWDKAIGAYKESIQYAPKDPRSHFYLGKLYLKLEKPSLAIEKLEESIKLDKSNTFAPEAKHLLGKIK
jgi:tetratricopeptide (TPR) repeat protein